MSTINPRARQLAQVSRAATQPARITQAARPTTSDPALNAWIGAMHEWRQVREGAGNPFEKVLTGRDLVAMGLATSTQITNPATRPAPAAPGVVISTPNGQAVLGWEQFTDSIRNSRLIRDINRRIDDPARFDELHERTRAMLLEELAPIDGKIRGEIRRVEEIATSAKESLAQEVTTIRASVARASAGVRQVRAASANENRATAAIVTTVTARLDGFDGGAATVEEVMSAVADRATGLEAQKVLKVTAGGAVAGYGVAATDDGAGNATSAFIIQADKFAIVSSSYAGGLDTTPDVSAIPFGIDGSGIYMTGAVRIDGSLLVSGTVTADTLNAATGSFNGSLNVGGTAVINGLNVDGSGYTALMVNTLGAAAKGVSANTSTSRASGGIAVSGVASAGGVGVYGSTNGGSGYGLEGVAVAASGAGVRAVGSGGAAALSVSGPMTIDNTTLVGNLNAQYLNGNPSSVFAAASHNHSGVYQPAGSYASSGHDHAGYQANGINIFNITRNTPDNAAYSTDGGGTWVPIQLKFT